MAKTKEIIYVDEIKVEEVGAGEIVLVDGKHYLHLKRGTTIDRYIEVIIKGSISPEELQKRGEINVVYSGKDARTIKVRR